MTGMLRKILSNFFVLSLSAVCLSSHGFAQGKAVAAVQDHDHVTANPAKDDRESLEKAAREQYVRMQEAWLGNVIREGGWRPDTIPSLSQASQVGGNSSGNVIPPQDLQSLLTNEHIDVATGNRNFHTKWNNVNMVDEITRLLVHIQNSATNSVNYYTHRLTVENIQGDIFISLYNVHQEFCHRLMNYDHYDPVIYYGVGYPQPQPVSDFCQDGDNVVVWKVPEYHNLLKRDFMQQIAGK